MMVRRLAAGLVMVGILGCGKDVAPEAVKVSAGVLGTGTKIQATIQTALSSLSAKPGDTLRAIVSRSVSDATGAVAIPAGSSVTLTVATLSAGNSTDKPDGTISLTATAVTLDVRSYAVAAAVTELPHHLEWRGGTAPTAKMPAYRDVIVSAGTPVVITLSTSLNVSTR